MNQHANVSSAPRSNGAALILFGRDANGRAHASWFEADDQVPAKHAAGLMGMHLLPVTDDEHRALVAKVPRGRLFASGRAFVPFVKGELYQRLAASGALASRCLTVGGPQAADASPSAASGRPNGKGGAIKRPAGQKAVTAPASTTARKAGAAATPSASPTGGHKGLGKGQAAAGSRKAASGAPKRQGGHSADEGSLKGRAGTVNAAPSAAPAAANTAATKPPPSWDKLAVGHLVLASTGEAEGWFEAAILDHPADDLFVLGWRDWPDEPHFTRRREDIALLHPKRS